MAEGALADRAGLVGSVLPLAPFNARNAGLSKREGTPLREAEEGRAPLPYLAGLCGEAIGEGACSCATPLSRWLDVVRGAGERIGLVIALEPAVALEACWKADSSDLAGLVWSRFMDESSPNKRLRGLSSPMS